MEEEYIEKIEKTILKCNECKLKECIGCEYTFNELQPLRYLLKRYKELEEENAMLKKAHNISEKVTVEDITQVMNKSLEDFKKEFIPTSVIQNKKSKLDEEDLEIYDTDSEDLRIAKYEQRAVLDFCNSLLEERNK